MKLAFVVQRYGAEVVGGSEGHCRQLALHLSKRHDITVLTTCAKDYVTWDNVYTPGASSEDGVTVVRFAVARPRRIKDFADLSDVVLDGRGSRDQQEAWFRENGPQAPELLDYLRERGRTFDLVVFWTFRYFPSYFGLPLVADRAVLVPTAEEEAAIDLQVVADFLDKPAGYVFLTPEEERLVSSRASRPLQPSTIAGIGLEPAPDRPSRAGLDALGLPQKYLLYLGRVDRNKGCDALLDNFQEYASVRSDATLVLAGPAKMRIPAHPQIRALGYVSDDMRESLLSHATALVVPSRYESLSIVLLEAWNHAVPALVNGHCQVLQGQVRRAKGGLYYRFPSEFSETADYLLDRDAEREVLGRQGLAYVNREYRWPTVLSRVESLLEAVRRQSAPRARTAPV